MGFKRGFTFIATVAMLASVAVGPGAGSADAASAQALDRNATLRAMIIRASGFSFDPVTTTSTNTPYLLPVYDRLISTQRDPQTGEWILVGQLAKSWTYSPDRLTITLNLRDDVQFRDGTPVDAAAVKANLDRAQTLPTSQWKVQLGAMTSVEAVGPKTVRVTLATPDSSFLFNFLYGPGMIANPAEFATLAEKPAGSGPYDVASFTSSLVSYERVSNFWDKSRNLVAKIEIQAVPDVNAQFNAFKSGQVDLVVGLDGNLIAQQVDAKLLDLNKDGVGTSAGFQVAVPDGNVTYGMRLSLKNPLFANPEVRQAVNMAIDRRAIQEALLPYSQLAPSIFTRGQVGYSPAINAKQVKYNPEGAKKLLEANGAAGATFKMLLANLAPFDQLGQAVAQQLKDAGLNVEITTVDQTASSATFARGDYEMYFSGLTPLGPGPVRLIDTLLQLRYLPAGLPPDLVALQDQARPLVQGSKEQSAAYKKINRYLVDNPLFIPVVSYPTSFLATTKVTNLQSMAAFGDPVNTDVTVAGVRRSR